MKNLLSFISEKLIINKHSKIKQQVYVYHPKTYSDLVILINKLINERGNNADLNDIDTSEITDMHDLFRKDMIPDNSEFDGDISKWDVSNVENMSCMFTESNFNGNISNWDVHNVIDMQLMFYKSNFNGDISDWDVSNVDDMHLMFSKSPLQNNPPKWYNI